MPDAPINEAALDELLETVGGDREFLAELVETYLADSPSLFAELRAAIAADDAATARAAGPHAEVDAAPASAPSDLAAAAASIEASAAAGDVVGLDEQVELAAAALRRRSRRPCARR